MKRKTIKKMVFKKGVVAKITQENMAKIRGGDCIPTEIAHTDWVCPGQHLP